MNLAQSPLMLAGVVGSQAYGLSTPDSDVDRMAIGVLPARAFLGLVPAEQTYVQHEPDLVVHEVGKFVSLCLKANPTVTELLYLDRYDEMNLLGQELFHNRDKLLSAHHVRNAYLGYATAQIEGALRGKQASKREKYARHAWRLSYQAQNLWRTGSLHVRLGSIARESAFEFGRTADEEKYRNLLYTTQAIFEKNTPLREEPDTAWADDFVTRAHLSYS